MASRRHPIVYDLATELRSREIERKMSEQSQHSEINAYTAAGVTARDIIQQCNAAAARGLRSPLTAADRRKIQRWSKRTIEQFYPTAADMNLPVSATWSKANPDKSYHRDIVLPAKIKAFRECNIKIPDAREKQWCQDLTCNTIRPPLHSDADVDAYIASNIDPELVDDVRYCKTTYPAYTSCINPQNLRQEYPESDFVTVDNAGGGNCFFLAVMTFVEVENNILTGKSPADIVPKMLFDCKESMDYRNNAVDWLVANQNEIIRPWFGPETIKENILGDIGQLYDTTQEQQNKAFTKYIRDMRAAVKYAGHPEWLAMSRVLGRTIMVFGLSEDGRKYVMRSASIVPGNPGGSPIIIKHSGGSVGGHYVAMIPKILVPAGVTLDRTTSPSFVAAPRKPLAGRIVLKKPTVASVSGAPPSPSTHTVVSAPAKVIARPPAPAPSTDAIQAVIMANHPTLTPKSIEIVNAILTGRLSKERCASKAMPRADKPTSVATGFLAKELIDVCRQLGGAARRKEDACAEIFAIIESYTTS